MHWGLIPMWAKVATIGNSASGCWLTSCSMDEVQITTELSAGMQVLPEHLGGDQRYPFLRHVEPLAIFLRVEPSSQIIRDYTPTIHDDAPQEDILPDGHLR